MKYANRGKRVRRAVARRKALRGAGDNYLMALFYLGRRNQPTKFADIGELLK